MKAKRISSTIVLGLTMLTGAVYAQSGAKSLPKVFSNPEHAPNLVFRLDENPSKAYPKELKEFRFTKGSGKLILSVGNAVIEGYAGDEVIISTMVEVIPEADSRAAGLQKINPSGLSDNTGLGYNRADDGDVTELSPVSTSFGLSSDTVFIRIPRNLQVSVSGGNIWSSGNLSLSNFDGEIELSTTRGDIHLTNITGPVTVKTSYGNIEAVFRKPVKGPVSLISNMGFVDVALPASIKANVELSTMVGALYASEKFDIQRDVPLRVEGEYIAPSDEEVTVEHAIIRETRNKGNAITIRGIGNFMGSQSNRLKGTLNGGGEHIIVKTTYGKIYLREIE